MADDNLTFEVILEEPGQTGAIPPPPPQAAPTAGVLGTPWTAPPALTPFSSPTAPPAATPPTATAPPSPGPAALPMPSPTSAALDHPERVIPVEIAAPLPLPVTVTNTADFPKGGGGRGGKPLPRKKKEDDDSFTAKALTAYAAFQAVKGELGKVGAIATEAPRQAAGGDNAGAVGTTAEGVASAARIAGTVVPPLLLFAGALDVAIPVVKTFSATVDAFVERGKYLAQYNANLAGAGAIAEVRSTMGDIKEANELGPELARLTDQQSRFSDELRDMLLPIKKWIIGVLADIMEGVRVGMATLKEMPKLIQEVSMDLGNALREALARHFDSASDWLKQIKKDVKRILDSITIDRDINSDVLDSWGKALSDAASAPHARQGDPIRQAARRDIQIPLIPNP